jgi:hypothetical protein
MIIYKLTYYADNTDRKTIEYSTSVKALRQKIEEWEMNGLNTDNDIIEKIEFHQLSELCEILNKDDEEIKTSECCGEEMYEDYDLCPKCLEHT